MIGYSYSIPICCSFPQRQSTEKAGIRMKSKEAAARLVAYLGGKNKGGEKAIRTLKRASG